MHTRALGAAVALLILLAAAVVGPASGGRDAARAQSGHGSDHPHRLSAGIAAAWIARQRPDGSFPDYMSVRGSRARDRYGEAMLGYGLLKTGLQRRDGRAVDAGLRALINSVVTQRRFHSVVFENFALAAGYNLARERVSRHPLFAASRARWEARLRRMSPTWLGRARGHYFNQHLVDAVAVGELARTGLRSRLPQTVSGDPARARRLAEDLVNRGLPDNLRSRTSRGVAAGTTALASDGALAYQALTLGFYARAIELLGARASSRARAVLDQLARASWALAGPDGDVAYFGRSQEQAWTLPLTAYGAEAAAAGARPAWAARHRGVSLRTLKRLREVHAGGPNGLYLTPAFRSEPGVAIAAQEDYVSGSAYSGLTLVGLGWAADRIGPRFRPAARLASDGPSAALLDRGPRRFATVSTGRVWFAVRRRPVRPDELGSGAGLIAAKVRDGRGRWHDVLAHGVIGRPGDSAGPLLRLRDGDAAVMSGRDLVLSRGPSVLLTGDLRSSAGRLVRRTAMSLAVSRCGVRIEPRGGRGDRWEYSVFLAAKPPPRRATKRIVTGGAVQAGYRGAGHIVTGRGYSSPAYGALVRSRMSVRGRPGFFVGLARGC